MYDSFFIAGMESEESFKDSGFLEGRETIIPGTCVCVGVKGWGRGSISIILPINKLS